MAGNRNGGLKAATTNKERYGDNFYSEIGAKGGRAGHTGGFATIDPVTGEHTYAKLAGAKGGRARLGWRKYADTAK